MYDARAVMQSVKLAQLFIDARSLVPEGAQRLACTLPVSISANCSFSTKGSFPRIVIVEIRGLVK